LEGCCLPFLRKLASLGVWQRKYKLSLETNLPFFEENILNLTESQLNFLYYLEFYNKIYEIEKDERPSDEVITNHFLCDEWIRLYVDKMNRKRRELNRSSNQISGKKTERMTINFDE